MKRLILAAAVAAAGGALLAVAPAPAHAQEYPWCAQYGGRGGGGGRNCGFSTYRQCMAAISGNGGFCERNSFYRGGPYAEGGRYRRRY